MCSCIDELEKELAKHFKNAKIERITFKEAEEFVDLPGLSLTYTRYKTVHHTLIACRFCPLCGKNMLENLHQRKDMFTFVKD